MNKQVLNVAFIGGGKGCYDILRLLKSYSPAYLQTHIIGVVDPNKDAIGRRHAERLDIPTQSDYASLLQNKELDLIIELTGNDSILDDIRKNKRLADKQLSKISKAEAKKVASKIRKALQCVDRNKVRRNEFVERFQADQYRAAVGVKEAWEARC